MIQPRLFLCSGVKLAPDDPLHHGRFVVSLDSLGPDPNVHIRLENLTKVFLHHLSPLLVDLLEIASYVYTADCGTHRGTQWTDDSTEAWPRDFRFLIPVREPDFWQSLEVQQTLTRALGFLSDDTFQFDFCALTHDRDKQLYLEIEQDDWPFYDLERVLMFSGGLDSLAGAVETAAAGNPLVLVSHRPVSTLSKRQQDLFARLKCQYRSRIVHIPVWINKAGNFRREHTQRTRSFLFSALGAAVACSVRAAGVRFFENGVVSLNFPVADEVLRARASRTTHPESLQLFGQLYSLLMGRELAVDNPFLFMTKAEVVSRIVAHGAEELIPYTCSCAHIGQFQSRTRWHCGTCSQCIDRRIAVLAAGQEAQDMETDYVTDVFTGSRKDGYEKNMAVNYARHAIELHQMGEVEMAGRFDLELTRAVRSFTHRSEAAQRLIELHKRHGNTAYAVLQKQISRHAGDLAACGLDESSLLAMVAGQQHRLSYWKRYADRILDLLRAGLPVACESDKPKDEPHCQQICDGILKGHDGSLVREYPFMRWSSSSTKPDWSAEAFSLWTELKYVRKKQDIRAITESIAADITKYGDNERRVLFVIYDPEHLVTNEHEFAAPITRRTSMLVGFIR